MYLEKIYRKRLGEVGFDLGWLWVPGSVGTGSTVLKHPGTAVPVPVPVPINQYISKKT